MATSINVSDDTSKCEEISDFANVGESILQIPALQKVAKPLSRVDARLVQTAEEIRQNAADEISYQHTVLCQTGLPYRETNLRRWERRNGRLFLEIEAGRALDPDTERYVDLPLPFGSKARLILIYLCSTAVRLQSQTIDVDRTMTSFITQLQGREPNGPEIRKFKQQIAAIAGANIRMATLIEGRSLQVNNQIVSKFDILLKKDDYSQRVLWPETVELTTDFFNTLKAHAVPLDQRAVGALAHSAMALDVYAWLAQRLCRIPGRADALVPWFSLHEQFGWGYKHIRQFRKVYLETLKSVLTQYPAADVSVSSEGLILKRSAPPITSTKLLNP